MTIYIVGTVVIGAAGLIVDNRLDKKKVSGMIIMATRLRTTGPGDCFCCGGRFAVSAVFFCPRFLIDFGNDSNHRQKRGFVKASF